MTRREQSVDLALGALVGLLAVGSALSASLVTAWDERLGGPGRGPWRHSPPLRGQPFVEVDVGPVLLVGVLVLVAGTVFRRRLPRLAYGLVLAGTAAYLAAGGPYGPVLLAPVLAVIALLTSSAATTAPPTATGRAPLRARTWPLLLGIPVMLSAGFWSAPYAGLTGIGLYAAVTFGTGAVLLPGVFAVLHRLRRASMAADRAAELRRVADVERLRIAQEVHDVVGHSLSVINLQAGVALHVLERQPEKVAASLEAIRASSKAALAELRTTLDLVREPGSHAPSEPLPGLDRLDALLQAVRAAGREVTVDIDPGVREGLPAAVDHAAYRIVQEAVTNAVRHAPGARISVAAHREPGLLVVEVADGGPAVDVAGFVEGTGISGLRERARALGGQLTVSTRPGGGVLVRAALPVLPGPGPDGADPDRGGYDS